MLKYVEMKKILNTLNEKWGLDFVSATSGNCCNTCGEMRTEKETIKWGNANTYLVVKWFFKGMNYNGKFDDQKRLFIKYHLGTSVSMSEVISDLEIALLGHYTVIAPLNSSQCIELKAV